MQSLADGGGACRRSDEGRAAGTGGVEASRVLLLLSQSLGDSDDVHYLEQSREDEVFDKRKGKVKNNNTEGAKVFKGEKWKVYKCVGCWLLV